VKKKVFFRNHSDTLIYSRTMPPPPSPRHKQNPDIEIMRKKQRILQESPTKFSLQDPKHRRAKPRIDCDLIPNCQAYALRG
jgi:hypothetical protein